MRNATEALESLGDQIGLGKLAFDQEGVCALIIGEDVEIFLHEDPDDEVLRLSGVLGDLDEDRPALPLRLLELNAGDGANGAAAFAVDSETDEILLVRALSLPEMTPDKLLSAVEEFVSRVQYWIETLPRLALDDEAEPQDVSQDDMIIRG
ncbi:MAG: type III secretion system chaperone [Methylocystis sp.]|uniref:type III secretion system chaperone n=1 Tax=Methylocystis sp. TaxID=1911079 RepID=UPI003DA2D24D